MNLPSLLLPFLPLAPAGDIEVFSFLDAESLEVGRTYEIQIEYSLGSEVLASGAGSPAPFLQIDVPASVELTGPYYTEYKELAQNEFLQMPFERLLEENPARISFKLIAEPTPEERIGLNVIAYTKNKGEAYFLRRRLEQPLTPFADSEAGDPENSSWGKDETLLQIGDPVAPFVLPRADGTQVSLKDYVGKKNIVVTTYRAFW